MHVITLYIITLTNTKLLKITHIIKYIKILKFIRITVFVDLNNTIWCLFHSYKYQINL